MKRGEPIGGCDERFAFTNRWEKNIALAYVPLSFFLPSARSCM